MGAASGKQTRRYAERAAELEALYGRLSKAGERLSGNEQAKLIKELEEKR